MTTAPDAWRIPATAQAILAARIDRLAPEDKRLLQAASVIGKDVPFTLLQAVADVSDDILRRGLSHLQATEFLCETSLFPDLEYTFKHAFTHEVAYGSVLHDRRRPLHARIVDAIEAVYPERRTEQVERLAYHAVRGEVWEKAVTCLRQAGTKAFTRSANREAAAYFEEALTALSRLPENRAMAEQGVDVRLQLRNSLWPLGRFETGFEHLRHAERVAAELSDQRRLGWIAAYMAGHSRMTGHAPDSPALAARALTIGERLADLSLCVAANYYLGTAYFYLGDYRRTDESFSKVLQLLKDGLIRERCGLAGFPAPMSNVFLALALAERGNFDQGFACAREAIRLAQVLDHPFSLASAYWALGCVHGVKGEVDQALRLAEQSLLLARDSNLAFSSLLATDLLGHMYALSGRVVEGLSLLHETLTAMESIKAIQYLSLLIVHLGEACVLAGQLDDAGEMARRGLALASERGHRGVEAWALQLLGEITSHPDRPNVATAEAHYRAAVVLAAELGMRPLVAHCHLGLGKLYRRTDKREQAEEHLATATTMYREMGMTYWLEKAEAEITKPER